jgi:hypothetical protein
VRECLLSRRYKHFSKLSHTERMIAYRVAWRPARVFIRLA